ncbi:MAG: glycine--tRNA ligase subunit beta, partial [Burkholderiales bacterium]
MQSENVLDADLLIEFLTEELPPINLEKNIGEAFTITLCQEIKGFLPPNMLSDAGNFGQNPHHFSIAELFITPRRFGCLIKQVRVREPEQKLLRKGPAIATALKNGEPTPALLGFAKACGLAWQDLEQRGDGYFYAQQTVSGRMLEDVLPQA